MKKILIGFAFVAILCMIGGAGYRFESEFNWALAVTAVDDLAYSG